MFISGQQLKKKISLAVTTYGQQSYYTQACLEAIRAWKNDQHELIVACHDQSLLLEFYLKSCLREGLIDQLLWTPPGYGHTRGVNLCFEKANGEFLFNICNDMLIGDALVGDCADKLTQQRLGMIGWHWYCEGTVWENDRISQYTLRDPNRPNLGEREENNIRGAHWFTGKAFAGLEGPKWIHLCNTSFFGMRREVWEHIGGFDFQKYPHYWADDFLNYAVLDQGLDSVHFESKFRKRPYFAEFAYDNIDVEDRRRNDDRIELPSALEDYTERLSGGLSQSERQLLFQIAKSLGPDKTVLHVGLWRGTGLCLFLKAMQDQPTEFIGIDCFDDAKTAQYSSQPPVSQEECLHYLKPFLNQNHTLQLIQANTLEMEAFPSADVIFVDAGHTRECIENDVRLAKKAVKPGGMLIFHDYGQESWPAVKQTIDAFFKPQQVRSFATLAVVQMDEAKEVSLV